MTATAAIPSRGADAAGREHDRVDLPLACLFGNPVGAWIVVLPLAALACGV